MTPITLQRALENLYGLERRKNKLGLAGTRSLLGARGDPQRRFRAIHVAGTNGKGTTCALIERALRAAGHRTGLFTSPHLVDFRERIRVNGHWADEPWLFDALKAIEALPGEHTFFEVATALGFGYFAARGVEWAVVETGLGGRLDTTNVLSPEVCAITNVGLDHTEILGSTIESIAFEKAGIVKPGVPVVLAPDIEPAARRVIEDAARERAAPVVDAREFGAEADGARGAAPHARANAAAARAVLATLAARGVTIPAGAIREGFAAMRWPGRFEHAPHAPRLWWDGAHNPQGVAALEHAWRHAGLAAPRSLVVALSRDKDAPAMLRALARIAPGAALVASRYRGERALDPDRVAAEAGACGFVTQVVPAIAPACHAALDAAAPDGLALLTGSLFAIGEAMESFGGAPEEDL